MHEPDQVVLLKMPPVRVHWLKVQTENTNKEAAKFTFPRVSQHYTNVSYLVDCILNILQFLKNYINQRMSVKVNNWKQTVDLNGKRTNYSCFMFVHLVFFKQFLLYLSHSKQTQSRLFFAHDQLLQQLHHLKRSIFIPFGLLSMHFKNYLEPVSVLCIEIYSKFRRNVR